MGTHRGHQDGIRLEECSPTLRVLLLLPLLFLRPREGPDYYLIDLLRDARRVYDFTSNFRYDRASRDTKGATAQLCAIIPLVRYCPLSVSRL